MKYTLKIVAAAAIATSLLSAPPAAAQDGKDETFRVSLLGTGTPFPHPWRVNQGITVELGDRVFVFDAGRGTFQNASKIFRLADKPGIAALAPMGKLDKMFLTHLHSDHIVGIPDWITTGALMHRKTPLKIWGPEGTKAVVDAFNTALEKDYAWRTDNGTKRQHKSMKGVGADITPGVVYDKDGVKITAFMVDHAEVEPAFGYRVDYDGRALMISGDTRFHPNLVKYGKGADLIIHSVGMAAERLLSHPKLSKRFQYIMNHHSSPEDLAKSLNGSQPKMAVLSHLALFGVDLKALNQAVRRNYKGPLTYGCDRMVFNVAASGISVDTSMAEKACLKNDPQ